MLRLFKSFFSGQDEAGQYPEELVKEAIERAVDGTDPWLRGLSGYKRKLRPAVIKAIDHVVSLVDGFDQPIKVTRDCYSSSPLLKAYFISAREMHSILTNDSAQKEFQKSHRFAESYALLAMEKQERKVFGSEMVGETIVRDVPRVTVSFSGHRLIDPTQSEMETRRMLKRRAFDHLLTLALDKIVNMRDERETLTRNRTLLQAKLNILRGGQWGFDEEKESVVPKVSDVEAKLEQIESQLLERGGDDRAIEAHLEVVKNVLGKADEHLWATDETVILDPMGVKRNQASEDNPKISLKRLQNTAGRSVTVSMIHLPETI
jgi:hypothetical protein